LEDGPIVRMQKKDTRFGDVRLKNKRNEANFKIR